MASWLEYYYIQQGLIWYVIRLHIADFSSVSPSSEQTLFVCLFWLPFVYVVCKCVFEFMFVFVFLLEFVFACACACACARACACACACVSMCVCVWERGGGGRGGDKIKQNSRT